MDLTEIRQNYPEYNDLSDEDLARRLHKRHYPDLQFDDFSNRIGYQPAERTSVAEIPEVETMGRAIEPEEGHWEGWIKPTLREVTRGATIGTAETAMALAGPIVTWPAGKLKGIATVIGSLFSGGNAKTGAEMARAAEEDVMGLGYQPYTPEAQKAVALVGKAFHAGLWPARKAGEELTKMGYPRLGYLVESAGEIVTFEVAHAIRRGVKARAKAKKAAKIRPAERPKPKIEELERHAKELREEAARAKAEVIKEVPVEERLRAEIEKREIPREVAKVPPRIEVKPKEVTLYRGKRVGQEGAEYYSPDKEWARQFTQSGLDKEITSITIPQDKIYRPKELPKAYGLKDSDIAIIQEAGRKGFKAIWMDEGKGQPDSVFIIDKKMLKEKPKEIPKPIQAELETELAAALERGEAKAEVPPLKEPGGIPNFTQRYKANKTDPTSEAYKWAKDATKEQYEVLKKEHAREGERLQKLSEELKKVPKGPERAKLAEAKSPREFERSFKGEALEAYEGIHGLRDVGIKKPMIEKELGIKLPEVKAKVEVVKKARREPVLENYQLKKEQGDLILKTSSYLRELASTNPKMEAELRPRLEYLNRLDNKQKMGNPNLHRTIKEFYEKVEDIARPKKVKPKAEVVKEPWEMSYNEYFDYWLSKKEPKVQAKWKGLGAKKDLTALETGAITHVSNQVGREHELIIKKAISEGKIPSHPDYPELGKKPPKAVTVEKDQFTLDRVPEPVTFARGEEIQIFINKETTETGRISGISHAKKEFKAGNVWYKFARAYKIDKPMKKPPKAKIVKKAPQNIVELKKLWPNLDFEWIGTGKHKGLDIKFGVPPEFRQRWISSARAVGPAKDQIRRVHETLLEREVVKEPPKAVTVKKPTEMTIQELEKESAYFDQKIKTEIERLDKIAPERQRFGEAGIEHLSPEDARRMTVINDELGRRTAISAAEAKKRVAKKRAARLAAKAVTVEKPKAEVVREDLIVLEGWQKALEKVESEKRKGWTSEARLLRKNIAYKKAQLKEKAVPVEKATRKVEGISYQYKGKEFTAKSYLDYKGYKIVKRHEKAYDILNKDNKIVGQMAGRKGAIERIDIGKELIPLEERYVKKPPRLEEITEARREYPEVKPPAREIKKYIRMMAEEVKEGEPPVTIKYVGEYEHPTYKRLPSTYPPFMVRRGWTGKEVVIALKKGLKGEKLGVKQQAIYDVAKEHAESRYLSDKAEVTLETFPGFQKMYEAVAKGQERKVRERVEAIRKEYLTPVEGNPLDKGAVEFLKSEKYKDYIKEMPGIGELKPSEIFKYDPEAKKLIATIETKEGKLKPAIRQSGYHALKEFSDSFEGAKDVSKLSASWTDPARFIEEIDRGYFPHHDFPERGMAQKHILWPSRMTTLSKLRWQDLRKAELNTLAEKYNVKSGKKARAIGDVIEHIETADIRKSAEQLLQNPKIQKFLKPFKAKVKTQILEAAKELRRFSDNLLDAQNIPRRIRKQKEIPKRAAYRTWIMETNLWSKLLGQKIRPEEIMERPTTPDFIFPNQPFNPRAEARTGLMAKYPKERNIIRLLTDYIDTAGKDIFDTNVVHNNKIHAAVLRSKGLENAAEGINRWTAEVFAGVDPRLTRWAKETVPPKARKGILAIRRNLTRAVFPLNWTWNLFIQTSSAGITYARYGIKANLAGLKYFLSPTMRRSIKRNAYSYIIKSRWGGKAHYQDVQKSISRNKRLEARPIEKVEDFLNYLTSSFEDGLTGHAVAAAYSKGKSLGLKGRELWEYASEGGAKTQSMYNYGDIPGMLRAREVGAVAPFQTFGFEVFNTIREMNFPGVRRLIGKTGLYETLSADSIAGKALMSNRLKMLARWVVAIAITDMVGEAAIGRKPWVVSSFVPFIGYIVGGYAGRGPVPHQYMQDAKAGIKDVLVYGNFRRLRKWVMRYHVLAGVQLERMIEGIEVVSKGGRVEDVRGRLLYKVEPEDYLKAITMGPIRTEAGKEYIQRRRESKSLLEQLRKKRKKKWRIEAKED